MRYNPNWSSHLPVLIKVLNISEGPVLEMGMGLFSTPVLHWLCLDQKRTLVSYDNNTEYFNQNKAFETDLHQIIFIEDWDKANIENVHWGLVFIDHLPDERRKVDIKRIANNADYIVVHDSEEKNEYKYHFSEIYSLFKYRFDYRRQKPYTTVLSNFKDLGNLYQIQTESDMSLKMS
jgi:hypothetical protein